MKTYLTIACLFASGAVAMASSVSSFGTLSNATWGGSGIDNNNAEITTITLPATAAANVITLGLEANPRLQPGVLGNNGAGIYFVAPGAAAGHPTWASWNMGFFIGSTPDNSLSQYTFTLSYGLEGGGSFTFDPMLISDNKGGPNSAQNSENLGFGFLSVPIGGFDPNASGIYDFTLNAYLNGNLLGSDSAKVAVGNVPDGGSTVAALGFAACALLIFKRASDRRQLRTVASAK
jgi:hypothetical protein